MESGQRLILIGGEGEDPSGVAERLRAQGYVVHVAETATKAAALALAAPPSAVIADLWMPEISGVQLCRLLRSEAATAEVPIILRSIGDAPRNRFWAERAGAAAYVPRGRIGELVRAIRRATDGVEVDDCFFTQIDPDTVDIRDRISHLLDRALFESVLASEIRALSNAGNFQRLFDNFSQFVTQIISYRWLATQVERDGKLAVHCHPACKDAVMEEVNAVFGAHSALDILIVEDEDAEDFSDHESLLPVAVSRIDFGTEALGKLAIAPMPSDEDPIRLCQLLGDELGGPLQLALVVEESKRLATYDQLTGILNRRAFHEHLCRQVEENSGLQRHFMLLDVDHFKQVNDRRGHAAGDAVLAMMGRGLEEWMFQHSGKIKQGAVARWGGEEFVVTFAGVTVEQARELGESLRQKIESLQARDATGEVIPVTASIGFATMTEGESVENLVERADQAMYRSKLAGRNRMSIAA